MNFLRSIRIPGAGKDGGLNVSCSKVSDEEILLKKEKRTKSLRYFSKSPIKKRICCIIKENVKQHSGAAQLDFKKHSI